MRKAAQFLRKIAAGAPLAAGLVLYSTSPIHSHRIISDSPFFRSPSAPLRSAKFRTPSCSSSSSSSPSFSPLVSRLLASPFSVVEAKESAGESGGDIAGGFNSKESAGDIAVVGESAGAFNNSEESARESPGGGSRRSFPPAEEAIVKSQKRRKINQLVDLVDTSDCKEDHRGAQRLLAEFTTPDTDDPKVHINDSMID